MMTGLPRGLTSVFPAEDSEEEEAEQDEEEDGWPEELTKGDKNSQLAVGFKGDRSYVVRGNNLGVFRHAGDQDKVEYYATISNIANTKGKKFNPKKVRQAAVPHVLLTERTSTGHATRLGQQDDLVRRRRPEFAVFLGH
jgi:hypothetical protein